MTSAAGWYCLCALPIPSLSFSLPVPSLPKQIPCFSSYPCSEVGYFIPLYRKIYKSSYAFWITVTLFIVCVNNLLRFCFFLSFILLFFLMDRFQGRCWSTLLPICYLSVLGKQACKKKKKSIWVLNQGCEKDQTEPWNRTFPYGLVIKEQNVRCHGSVTEDYRFLWSFFAASVRVSCMMFYKCKLGTFF